jgi:hypothetical protein
VLRSPPTRGFSKARVLFLREQPIDNLRPPLGSRPTAGASFFNLRQLVGQQ